jgi:signal transduction histidine kinase
MKKIHLLLIEDDKEDALLVKDALRGLPIVITVKTTLADGLASLPGRAIVLLDLRLPDSEGLSGLVKIRQAAPKTPIIVLTGSLDEDIGRAALGTGADDFLDKNQLSGRSLERSVEFAIARRRFQNHALKVSALKRKNKLLARTELAQRDFVANVSHELRTPVAAISGFAETLNNTASGRKGVMKSFLKIIHNQAKKLSWLVNDFMSLSEIQAGHAKLHAEELALGKFLTDCLEGLKPRLKRNKLRVLVTAPRSLSVQTDRNYLALAIHNLLDNAAKHSDDESRIELRAFPDGSAVTIEIQDHGHGIPANELPRIFERFYRGAGDRAAGLRGSGVGLSLVKAIVELHGGAVSVASRPGEGTTFTLRLPRTPASPPRRPRV